MRLFFIFVSIAMQILGSGASAQAADDRPIVFIPGILGSKLCDKDDRVVWGNGDSLWNFEELALAFDAVTEHLEHHPCGVLKAIGFAGIFSVDQYGRLLSFLRDQTTFPGRTVHEFAYDWRLSNFHSAKKLQTFIEENFSDPDQKVDIVAHSMGGLVARIYLQELGGDKRVNRLLMMGTPHRGSGQVFKTVEEGWGWWQNAMAGGLPDIRKTLMSFPSVYQLLPSYQNCCGWRKTENAPVEGQFSAFDAAAWQRFSWLPPSLRTPAGKSFLAAVLADGRRLSELTKADLPPSVRHGNIVTGLVTTQWKSYFNPQTGDFSGKADYPGDGTVMEWSAANGAPSTAKPAQGPHQTIFTGPGAKTALRWFLNDDAEPKSGFLQNIRGSLVDAKGDTIELYSIEYEATPQISKPGGTGIMVLRLRGGAALQDADLSNLQIVMGDSGQAIAFNSTASRARPDGQEIERVVTARFTAPVDFGVHRIRSTIPGVATFDEYLVVTKD